MEVSSSQTERVAHGLPQEPLQNSSQNLLVPHSPPSSPLAFIRQKQLLLLQYLHFPTKKKCFSLQFSTCQFSKLTFQLRVDGSGTHRLHSRCSTRTRNFETQNDQVLGQFRSVVQYVNSMAGDYPHVRQLLDEIYAEQFSIRFAPSGPPPPRKPT